VEPVAKAKIPSDQRYEPRLPVVKRVGREVGSIESRPAVGDARDLAGVHGAEIGHHGDARAVAAQGIMKSVQLAHVRQLVESKSDVTHPSMRDPTAPKLWKAVAHK